jgi:hypothetical protein
MWAHLIPPKRRNRVNPLQFVTTTHGWVGTMAAWRTEKRRLRAHDMLEQRQRAARVQRSVGSCGMGVGGTDATRKRERGGEGRRKAHRMACVPCLSNVQSLSTKHNNETKNLGSTWPLTKREIGPTHPTLPSNPKTKHTPSYLSIYYYYHTPSVAQSQRMSFSLPRRGK